MLIDALLAGCISICNLDMPEDIYDDAAVKVSILAM